MPYSCGRPAVSRQTRVTGSAVRFTKIRPLSCPVRTLRATRATGRPPSSVVVSASAGSRALAVRSVTRASVAPASRRTIRSPSIDRRSMGSCAGSAASPVRALMASASAS